MSRAVPVVASALDPPATVVMRSALIRLALLMRVVPLLQAAATLAFGFSVYQRVWLGAAAGFLALAWSAWLTLRVWSGTRNVAPFCPADTLIAVLALLAVGPALPSSLLATAFYWPATYGAVVALMLAMSLPLATAATGLGLLLAAFGLVTGVQAGADGIAAAAGNMAGSAVYFAIGAVIAAHARKLTDAVARSSEAALRQEMQLGVEQARLDEFRRLHDEAVQVFERVSVADSREAAGLRAYAASAAAHLRAAIAAIGQPGPAPLSVRAALDRAAAGFAALGFDIAVRAEEPLPDLDEHALAELGSAVTEALNNSFKHSGAGRAVIRACRARDRVEVSVADEGAGFAAEQERYGFGITHSICRRLAEAGGGAEIRSAPGAGTVVTMWLPC
jgi:signal transduction histidine kinase